MTKWIVGGLVIAVGGYAWYRWHCSQQQAATTAAATAKQNPLGVNVYSCTPAPSNRGQLQASKPSCCGIPGATVPNIYSPPLGPGENQPAVSSAVCSFVLLSNGVQVPIGQGYCCA